MRTRNIIQNAGLAVVTLLASAFAAPIPVEYLGLGNTVQVTNRSLVPAGAVSFNARVGNPTLANAVDAFFWCVDLENYIDAGASSATYLANLIPVNDTTAQAALVRKGTTTSWEDNQSFTAQQRYSGAAFLVEMMMNGGSGHTNAELQNAIWRLTDAQDAADNTGLSPYWENAAYSAAKTFIQTGGTTQHTWATVSGVVSANGALTSNTRQTFLVQVDSAPIPEPGTYALIAGGLLLIAGLRRRTT